MVGCKAVVFLNRVEIDANHFSACGEVSVPVVADAAELFRTDLSLVSRVKEKDYRLPSGLAEAPVLSIPIGEIDFGCELAHSRARGNLGTGHVSCVLQPASLRPAHPAFAEQLEVAIRGIRRFDPFSRLPRGLEG